MKLPLLMPLLLLLFSCKKTKIIKESDYSEATYAIEVKGLWASPDFTVPAGVHFTNFAGMVHNADGELWKPGKLATKGVENVAETGSTTAILLEIDSVIRTKNALSLILFTPPSATGMKKSTIYCNSNYSMISVASMIAPSPDWFIGLSGLNLFTNKKWVADTTVQLFVYDSGTEEGDVFGYSNPPTTPQQPIKLLDASAATVLANSNSSLKAIAEIRLLKL
ncbi:spondin domain-containing protein [Lacibacter sp. MH-610]|uniref:spondin domain-containing protein n=1 Tax=Lacibacter sp. MH-610 TaxID=3020883 RepID=UPI0038929EFC